MATNLPHPHRRILKLIVRVNELCTASSTTPISLRNPVLYADRCRERRPGDESFALGPHTDSGTIERWEDPNYSSVYRQIVTRWEDYDPWNIDGRVEANTDMYDSPGGSSVFRTFQVSLYSIYFPSQYIDGIPSRVGSVYRIQGLVKELFVRFADLRHRQILLSHSVSRRSSFH